MDIVIYTRQEILYHKQGKNQSYYWEISRPPKKFKVGERIYFAIKGQVVGSFKCRKFNPEKDEYGDPVDCETIVWDADSWKELEKPIPTKHFQGFRYKWW